MVRPEGRASGQGPRLVLSLGVQKADRSTIPALRSY